jgi:cyclophilin family peptidyl-prolyl cis-trans isomerase
MRLVGIAEAIDIELDAEAEPDVCGRVEDLASGGFYDGARLRVKADTAAIELAQTPPFKRVEPRRVRHSQHLAGAVSWCWSRVPSDGDGSLFLMCRDEPGYDAAYQTIGRVISGLGALLALPAEPTARLHGQKAPAPVIVETIRRGGMSPA